MYCVIILCVSLLPRVYCFTTCLLLSYVTLVAGLLARSQYPEGLATGHLDTGFSWFPCFYKRMLSWFPRLQVATACFSCSPPDLNFLDNYFIFIYMDNNHCHRVTAHLQSNILCIITTSLVVYWSESLTTNHEVPGSIPGSIVGIFLEGEDSHADHGLGRLV